MSKKNPGKKAKIEKLLSLANEYPEITEIFGETNIKKLQLFVDKDAEFDRSLEKKIQTILIRFSHKKKVKENAPQNPQKSNIILFQPRKDAIEREKLQKNLNKAIGKINSLECKIAEMEEFHALEIEQLRIDYESKLDVLELHIKNLKMAKKDLQKDNLNQKSQIIDLKKVAGENELRKLAEKNKLLSHDVSKQNRKISNLEIQLEAAKNENAELSEKLSKATSKLSLLTENLNNRAFLLEKYENLIIQDASIKITKNAEKIIKDEIAKVVEYHKQANLRIEKLESNSKKKSKPNLAAPKKITESPFDKQEIELMKSINVMFVRTGSALRNKSGRSRQVQRIIEHFGQNSTLMNNDRPESASSKIVAALRGSKFDFVVIYDDANSHALSYYLKACGLERSPKLIRIQAEHTNPNTVKKMILERFKKNSLQN